MVVLVENKSLSLPKRKVGHQFFSPPLVTSDLNLLFWCFGSICASRKAILQTLQDDEVPESPSFEELPSDGKMISFISYIRV